MTQSDEKFDVEAVSLFAIRYIESMKLILAFLFSGVACSLASPTCTEEELQKCYKYDPRSSSKLFVETDEDLEKYCKSLGCQLEYRDRCGNRDLIDMPELFNQMKIVYDGLCKRDNPLRQRFLDNAVCLNRVTNIADNCRSSNGIDTDHEEYCKEIKKSLECAYDMVEERCGKEGRDVYAHIYPGYEFHGCSE